MFDIIKGLGHRDALVTLSTLAHESQDEGIRMAAAAALAPYAHPKLQALPTPRFIDNPIDVPDFTSVEIAEDFLARLPVLVARGELDFQSAQELCAMTKLWIDAKNDRSELELKVINQGGETEQAIHISGGLPELPGTHIDMPKLNGHKGFQLLEPSQPVAPSGNESIPADGQGPETQGSNSDSQAGGST